MLIFSIETLQDKRQKVSNMFCSYNGRLLVGTVHLGNIISVRLTLIHLNCGVGRNMGTEKLSNSKYRLHSKPHRDDMPLPCKSYPIPLCGTGAAGPRTTREKIGNNFDSRLTGKGRGFASASLTVCSPGEVDNNSVCSSC